MHSLRADKLDDATMSQLLDAHLDITGAAYVELKTTGKVAWVNVNGVCVLRVCNIKSLAVEDPHEQPVAWLDPKWTPEQPYGPTSPVTTYEQRGWKPLYGAPQVQHPTDQMNDDLLQKAFVARHGKPVVGMSDVRDLAFAEFKAGWKAALAARHPEK